MTFNTLRPVLDEDHVAIITGGAQNIGEAIARTFAAAGAKVMIADLNGEKAESAAVSIAAETGQQVIGMKCDVTDDSQVQACFRRLSIPWRSNDTVNNVGWAKPMVTL